MQVPRPSEFSDYRAFLVALIAANKSKRFFSSRFLARKFGYPVSYLNDVISGRKSLTLNRAIPLAKALKLDDLDTEYLIILVLQENPAAPVRQYFSDFLRQRYRRHTRDYIEDKDMRYADISVFALQTYAAGKRASDVTTLALNELYTFTGMSAERIESALAILLEDGHLELDGNGYYRERRRAFVQADNLQPGIEHIHAQYGQNFVKYCDHRLGPATLNSFFKRIPRSRFIEVQEKLLAIRDWLRQLNFNDADNTDSIVFQCDLNIFPITDTRPSAKKD